MYQDLKGCFQESSALNETQHETFFLPQIQQIWDAQKSAIKSLPCFQVLSDEAERKNLKELAQDWGTKYDRYIVFGTGGSSLGGKTLCRLENNPFSPSKVSFLENVDPDTFQDLCAAFDLKRTGFLIISKSGATSETLCQFLCLLAVCPDIQQDQIRVITETKESPLYLLAQTRGFTILPHHNGIGGRFSVFSNVGLLPALIQGVDIDALHQGALEVLDNPQPVLEGVALACQAMSQNLTMSVMMPYHDRLEPFAAWYAQIWAESLGKDGQGTTPIKALGTVDQHSMLQLFRDGPKEKLFTLIGCEKNSGDFTLAKDFENQSSLSYFKGQQMGDLLSAEFKATRDTLEKQGCPVRTIIVPEISAKSLGSLLCHFMLETILTARFMKVDPFDQPGVEESKVLTRAYLMENHSK